MEDGAFRGAVPASEIERRHARCRAALAREAPGCDGLLVFSRLNIYYLGGTFGNGVLWLPLEGRPVLLIRRGVERARLESPLPVILPFRSYKDLPGLLGGAGSPLAGRVAAEMGGLSWLLARSLTEHLGGTDFVPGDRALALARAVKSELELDIMRRAGALHDRCLRVELPARIRPGMTEREISLAAWDVFFAAGHQGMLRMGGYGEEIFLGHIAAGDSANYPSVFDGPVGLRGTHPAVPFMGDPGRRWEEGELLTCDIGFGLEGYQTDKTQVYWAGRARDLPDGARRAHDFCVEVQAWLAGRAVPGAVPSELAAHCFAWAEREGLAEGFMALGGNKVTFLGHGIGLAIDEYPVLAKGFDDPLEAGMVLALEPKIGLPDLGMVGVENTFEVTPSGGRCLTGGDYAIVCRE